MTIKRNTREGEFEDITGMANFLVTLSTRGGAEESNRMFECKTCNRQFPSFQALGGHRASHKKPRLTMDSDKLLSASSPPKPKTHECSICGLEFSIGQALGGHMRRHKAANNEQKQQQIPILSLSLSHAPVVKKSNSRRVLCPDLNLTPSENNFIFGKINAPVYCFL